MKSYSLINRAPGPRGIQTAAAGLIMLQPALAGTSAGTTAILTDDELKSAKALGFEIDEEATDGEITGRQTSNLPAEGQIDYNTEEGEEIAALERKLAEKRAAAAARGSSAPVASEGSKGRQAQPGNPKPQGNGTEPVDYDKLTTHAQLEDQAKADGFEFGDDHKTVDQRRSALAANAASKVGA